MSIRDLLDTGVCPPSWTQIRSHRLHSCTDIQFDRDLIGLIRLNGNVPPGANRTFLHTDAVGIIAWKTFSHTDLPPGAANQILVTDNAGTAVAWADNVRVNGSLTMASNATALQTISAVGDISSDTSLTTTGFIGSDGDITSSAGDVISSIGDIIATIGSVTAAGDVFATGGNIVASAGDIIATLGSFVLTANDFKVFNNLPGNAGDVLYSDGANNPPYWDVIPSAVQTRTAKYYDNNVVDMNGAAAVLLFSAASVDIASTYVSYTAGALGGFTLSTAGIYDVTVTTLASTAQYRSQINVKTNAAFRGSIKTPYDGVNTNPQSVVFKQTIYCNAADVLTIVSQTIVAGVVNTTGNDANGISQTIITITWMGPT